MNENKTYPIERVLMDADHMAKVATELLAGCASLAIASNAVNDEETAENLAALEQAEVILGEQAHAMRLAMHEYRKRAQRYRDSLAESATAELAAKAKPVEVHGLGTPNVDVSVHDGKVVHYDNGPNLAEALARLASRVAKVRNLPAPTITAQPPAVAVAVPDGWDAESVRLAFSTLRYIIGLKPDGIKAPFDHVQDIIEKVASWSDMGPCHPVRKQYEAAAAHRAMLAAAPQGAGDFKSWDAGAHEWWKARAAAPQAATEGCGACGDGCKGQGCRLERESPPTCQKCNGAGVIRGLLSNGGGSYAEPCPDCTAPEPTAEDSSVVGGAGAAPAEWPTAQDVGRIGDMSKVASLRVGLDADSDVYVCIHGEAGSGSVEFCVPGSGGGKSPRTRAALISLMVAMEADNAETPARDWWKAREGDEQKGGAA